MINILHVGKRIVQQYQIASFTQAHKNIQPICQNK